MADFRALLAAERASCRITHLNAAYTADGKLRCNLCKTVNKLDFAWQAHLHSTIHILCVSRESESLSRGLSKNRKGTDSSPDALDEGKRAKADDNEGRREVLADLPPGMEDEAEKLAGLAAMARGIDVPAPVATTRVVGEFGLPQSEVSSQSLEPTHVQALPTARGQLLGRTFDEGGTKEQNTTGDDDEHAAVERELADLKERTRISALQAKATITIAAMTAEVKAAQAREAQSARGTRRDVEIGAERDDAASALRDEFAEMDGKQEGNQMKLEIEMKGALAVEAQGTHSLQVGTGNLLAEDGATANDTTT
ncbi:hypothetical protein LTR56_026452 [Elasticomyces elasticus]|nr:hypothetical protein LTR56_026452 [Elasticomyces elasticus]KAK4903724.1 hypothetical protein LTR49_026690 [Elasticomyces elasticus]KAK5735691.1 hypothetical protein LTS12_026406 [Elasticomyces elasticus]